jgi:hypothetical protein
MTYQCFMLQRAQGQVSHMPCSTRAALRLAVASTLTEGEPTISSLRGLGSLRRWAPIPWSRHHAKPFASRSTSRATPTNTISLDTGSNPTAFWLIVRHPSLQHQRNRVSLYEQRTSYEIDRKASMEKGMSKIR